MNTPKFILNFIAFLSKFNYNFNVTDLGESTAGLILIESVG